MLKTIGYLGPKATFTEQAVRSLFKVEPITPLPSIPACLEAVHKGEIEFGVVPIENTIEGSVTLTVDYLIHEYDIPIIGEVIVPIQQHFMVHPYNKTRLHELDKVLSHPHALAQCRKFLQQYYPNTEQVQTLSTSAAAQYVKENGTEVIAAIANELAAKEYGLEMIRQNIHDYDNNHTRFVILHRDSKKSLPQFRQEDYKTTLVVTLPLDQAGALHQVLSVFAWRKLNLSKIESRPMKTGLGNYLFIIDVDHSMDHQLLPGALQELEALGCGVSCLGSYPIFKNLAQNKF
jgi:prephenate dehydratase